MNLAALFERERNRLWTQLGRVAEKHPALAPLLSRDGDDRFGYLVEAGAYGFARLREVLGDDAPQETHGIVGTSLPEVIRPTPARSVAQWTPTPGSRSARTSLEDGELLRSEPVGGGGLCEFRTLWPVVATPLDIVRSRVETTEAGKQVLKLRFSVDPDTAVRDAFPRSLRLFAHAEDPVVALDVVQAVLTNVSISVGLFGEAGQSLRGPQRAAVTAASTALSDAGAPLPGRRDAFASHALIRTAFAFPEILAFFELHGLDDAVREASDAVRFVEVIVAFAEPVPDGSRDVSLLLHCVPCANVRSASFAPLRFSAESVRQRISPERIDDTEVFEIDALEICTDGDGAKFERLRVWHRDDGRILVPGEVVAKIHRRAGPLGGRTQCDIELVALGGGALPRACSVTVHATVTDGARADRLLPRALTATGKTGNWVNISRVVPAIPMTLDRQLPWRANAYARISAREFASARGMRGFFDMLDFASVRPGGATRWRAIERVTRASFKRIVEDQVHGGEVVDVVMNPAVFGGRGVTWFLGELLARALAERTDVLRFSRLRWVGRDGTLRTDYGVRQGERLPFPFS